MKRAWSKHPRNHRQAPQASQTTTSQGRKSIKESNHQHQAPQASQSATKQKQSKTHTATSTTTTCPSSAAHVCAPSSSCHQPSWFGSDVNTLGDVAFCHKLSKAPPTVRTGHPASSQSLIAVEAASQTQLRALTQSSDAAAQLFSETQPHACPDFRSQPCTNTILHLPCVLYFLHLCCTTTTTAATASALRLCRPHRCAQLCALLLPL